MSLSRIWNNYHPVIISVSEFSELVTATEFTQKLLVGRVCWSCRPTAAAAAATAAAAAAVATIYLAGSS